MNEILSKEQLSADVWKIRVHAPHIVAERKPGQFIILQVDHDFGERIPLTIADADPADGSITLVVFKKEMRAFADEVILCTDDGSAGRKALVTAPLKELCDSPAPPDEVIAIGPPIMMKFCAETTRPYGIHTVVSLNTIMIDGTGMCGGCRVSVGGETKFVCVDGPEFDGHLVDFDNMMRRMRAYKPEEDAARQRERDHICNLEKAAAALAAAHA